MRVCVIAGGVGAARLLSGLVQVVDPTGITAVVNVGDDDVLHGLRVSPDLDTITYTLAGAVDPGRGWGLRGETWQAMESLRRYAAAAARPDIGWFNLGDRDLGTHLWRSTRLDEGATLTQVTAEITRAWGLDLRLLPVTDDPVATVLERPDGSELSFQEYFVREHHGVAVSAVSFRGAATARPGPDVVRSIADADAVIIAPSNPVISIAPVLAVPGVRAAVRDARDRCVAVSPIVGGAALKGPADRLLRELGHEVSVVGIAHLSAELASTLVIDEVDAALAPDVEGAGIRCVVAATVMATPAVAASLASTCLAAVTP